MAKSNPGGGGPDKSKKYGDILKNGMQVGKTYRALKPDKLVSHPTFKVWTKKLRVNNKIKKK